MSRPLANSGSGSGSGEPSSPRDQVPGDIPRPDPLGGPLQFIRELATLKQRLQQEATIAVGMLESSVTALFELSTAQAQQVLDRDDTIDREEVEIEAMCFRLMALHRPVARDFRQLAFILKVNSDLERVGDHACSIAKMTSKLREQPAFAWPTALTELGSRVPIACHRLLRALINEDAELAKSVVVEDKVLDRINRQLFDETVTLMRSGFNQEATGLHVHRVGRELERVGDLMTNVAENIVFLVTGEIIRHEKKRLRERYGRA
jgi:phosphate transport system protein